ncbi:glutathione S-transferase family protein [Sphingosinicellaceae bacterium]|nr:glutathione S-transferase family protein [Sphingosinicellaceae bacterium]
MMLYGAPEPAPNPRRVTLLLREKGISLPVTNVALMKGEHKSPAIVALNPRGQVPFLVLDDGRVLAETVAICRYLDELHPEPPLFGTDAWERAETDMWVRRVETTLGVPVSLVWVHGHALTATIFEQIPAVAEQARGRVAEVLKWFDEQLAGKQWLAGDRYTVADIVLLTVFDFAVFVGIPVPGELTALHDWHRRATARYA